MEVEAKPDFSGYATKAGLKCTDGRTILPNAFKHQDKLSVPLVWQHNHNSPDNVLGHVILENRDDGTYCYAFLNDTPQGKNARILVHHGDVKSLSIYANELAERAKQVLHGMIREVSLVLSGSNPGALIDYITLAHGDGEMVTLEDEAIIYTGEIIHHADETNAESNDDSNDESDNVNNDESNDETNDDSDDESDNETNDESDNDKNNENNNDSIDHSNDDTNNDTNDDTPSNQELYESMTPEQKDLVHMMVGAALENDLTHDDKDKEGQRMKTRNVFEQENEDKGNKNEHALTHDALVGIVDDAKKFGSLKESVEAYALKHGIENIDVLFPEARNVADSPEFLSRRLEWVTSVLDGTKHSPFARIKSIMADITFDEARARGYAKGNLKKEEWFSVAKRITTPATIYKKQRLDRDDIIDITDFDVVIWLKGEMRLMFDEELARAILIGDGREVDDDDKIKDPAGAAEGAGIRSILNDHDLYAATFTVDDSAIGTDIVDAITLGMGDYKGSGGAVFYTTFPVLTGMLLTRDDFGHRLWKNKGELATELGVSDIVVVEAMESEANLLGIVVNLRDYTIGADKGGEVSFFDFFDIDYNQYKYLYESRLSGALTMLRSALVIKRAASGDTLATPAKPDFDGTDVTITDTTGVIYKNGDGDVLDNSGSPYTLAPGESLTVYSTPDTGYYFDNNVDDQWTFMNRSSI